jgi:hypothetical protein
LCENFQLEPKHSPHKQYFAATSQHCHHAFWLALVPIHVATFEWQKPKLLVQVLEFCHVKQTNFVINYIHLNFKVLDKQL